MVEEKARKAVAAVREASSSPLLATMPKVKTAVLAMAEAVEAMAHEVEVLKVRFAEHERGVSVVTVDGNGALVRLEATQEGGANG